MIVLLTLIAVVFASPPTSIVVDLDAEPSKRWPVDLICTRFVDGLRSAKALIGDFLSDQVEREIAISGAAALIPYLGEFGQEIKSFADNAHCGKILSLGEMVLLNVIYEVESGCTSIVARQTDQSILHGRNLDFPDTNALRELTVRVEFQRRNQTAFLGATFAGYVGLLTAMRPNGWSVTMDQRGAGNSLQAKVENALAALTGAKAVPFLVRELMADANVNYDAAVEAFVNAELVTTSYLIVGGVDENQGTVITRDRLNTVNQWPLNTTSWYRVETNYDHWKKAGDDRRATAEKALDALTQSNLNLTTLYRDVLLKNPVFNGGTTYTAMMHVAKGILQLHHYPNNEA